jgi:hypothetical protein
LHQQQLKEFKHDVVQAVSATEDQSHQAITKAIRFLAIVERTLKRPLQPKKKTSNPKV